MSVLLTMFENANLDAQSNGPPDDLRYYVVRLYIEFVTCLHSLANELHLIKF